MVGEKGMPLKEKEYLAVPAFTLLPAGISAINVIEESSPGTTGSGSREPPVNLKTEVPCEQSVTEFETVAFKMAERAYNTLNRPIYLLITAVL